MLTQDTQQRRNQQKVTLVNLLEVAQKQAGKQNKTKGSWGVKVKEVYQRISPMKVVKQNNKEK